MQDYLHHRELVEVGIEQRRDDHAGAAGARDGTGSRSDGVAQWYALAAARANRVLAESRQRRRRVRAAVDDANPPDEPHAEQRAADRQPADGAEVRQRAVGRTADDEPAASDAIPDASCWIDALKLMKLPRSRGSTLPVTSAIAGPNRPGTNTKNSTRQRDDPGERQRRQMRHRRGSVRSRSARES